MAVARTVAVNLAIRGVSAVVDGFDKIDGAARSSAKTLEKHSVSADKLGSSMLKMGVVAAAGMAYVVNAAMDWQSEWTGVAKTVNGTTAELNALQGSLRQMAKDIPASTAQIASVAENAGQLGVATGNIAAFTRVMIDMGNTTNLTADEASSTLAQFMNIMQTAGGDVDRLGATIVALGNNGASTERDITEMALRIAGAGRAVRMSESEVLAYASALASAGVDAEAGGTAISQSFLKIDAAVRAGGDGLQILAEVSGMTADQFSQAWGTDAAQAMNVFLKGLAKIQSQGGSVTAVLGDLGIDAIRQSDALRRLASSGDLLTQSLETGNSAWSANSALINEATKRYSTAESQMTVAWNRINDTAITVGGKVLPVVAGLAEGAGRLVEAFGSVPGPVLSVAASLGSSVAIMGLAGGGLLKLASSGMKAYQSAQDLASAWPNAAGAIGKVTKNALAAAVAIAAMGAAYAAAKSAGIENMFGGLDDAAGAMANLSSKTGDASTELDKFFQDAKGSWGSNDLVEGVNSLESAFTRVSQNDPFRNAYDGFQGFMMGLVGARSETALVTEQFGKLDKGLSAMSSGGAADQAAASFKKIAAAAKDVTPERLIQLFPEYATQIRSAGTAAGYTYTSSEDLAKAMQGDLPAGMSETQKAAVRATGAIQAQATSLKDLTDAYWAASSAALKTSGSAIGFEAAIDDATKAAKENGKTLDINTEAGRNNRKALDEMAGAASAYISQLTTTNAETSTIVSTTQRAHDQFVATAQKMGYTAAQAEELAKQYGLVPADVKTSITTPGASQSRQSVEDLKTSITSMPPNWQTYILTVLNTQGIDAAYAAKKDLETHPVQLKIVPVLTGSKTGVVAAVASADGNLFKAYAAGGIESHVAQIAPAGAMRLWAEPETGGESYIPLAQEKWPRSREIWWETGKHLGLVAHADGGMYSGASSNAPSVSVGAPNVTAQVFLDGNLLDARTRVIVGEVTARQQQTRRRNTR